MTDSKVICLSLLLILVTACQQRQTRDELNNTTVKPNMAEQFLFAYNRHDQEQMLKLVHPKIKYMYIDGDQIYTETNSRSDLAEFLVGYFQNKPNANSRALSSFQQGPFIQQVEQALWVDASGQPKSQCSLSIYEIKQQLIINIWYFATFECPKDRETTNQTNILN